MREHVCLRSHVSALHDRKTCSPSQAYDAYRSYPKVTAPSQKAPISVTFLRPGAAVNIPQQTTATQALHHLASSSAASQTFEAK
jgi:hypothetical protein